MRQTWGSNKIDFAYDDQGRPYSLTYNGTTYYYVLNLQGDVIRIVNSGGNVAADYTYDAWGNVLSAMGTLADVNPLRYRGYVYDAETGLYYLNSRYYDPVNCRMLSPDDLLVLNARPTSLNDKNLFAYCDNNPVSRYDADGGQSTRTERPVMKMSKVAVVYWSGTGNTEAMASAVAESAKGKGAEVAVLTATEFAADQVEQFDAMLLAARRWGRRRWMRVNLNRCFLPARAS